MPVNVFQDRTRRSIFHLLSSILVSFPGARPKLGTFGAKKCQKLTWAVNPVILPFIILPSVSATDRIFTLSLLQFCALIGDAPFRRPPLAVSSPSVIHGSLVPRAFPIFNFWSRLVTFGHIWSRLVISACLKPASRVSYAARGAKFRFDRPAPGNYFPLVPDGIVSAFDVPRVRRLFHAPLPAACTNSLGRKLFRFLLTVQGLGAFALITLGVLLTKFRVAPHVIRPLTRREIDRAGLRLLPMFLFLAAALGFLVIGQTVSWLTRVGAIDYLGTVMVVVVVRELGPLLTALVALARIGTANVVELGTARALGEVEALEALGIDPVHYLVVPRVVGMALGIFSLTVYLILGALLSGYLWAFLQDVPLLPGDYFRQLAGALRGLDFALLALKTVAFGLIISIVTCYHGLAQPLRLPEVSHATVRAVAQSLIACVLLDVLFIIIYLLA